MYVIACAMRISYTVQQHDNLCHKPPDTEAGEHTKHARRSQLALHFARSRSRGHPVCWRLRLRPESAHSPACDRSSTALWHSHCTQRLKIKILTHVPAGSNASRYNYTLGCDYVSLAHNDEFCRVDTHADDRYVSQTCRQWL